MDIEELAFKKYYELKDIQKVDLLLIIEFLQKDRKQWINQYTQAHDDYVVLQQENQQLKRNCNIGNENLKFYRQENKQLKDRINKAVECIEKVLNSYKENPKNALGLNIIGLLEILKEDNKED